MSDMVLGVSVFSDPFLVFIKVYLGGRYTLFLLIRHHNYTYHCITLFLFDRTSVLDGSVFIQVSWGFCIYILRDIVRERQNFTPL